MGYCPRVQSQIRDERTLSQRFHHIWYRCFTMSCVLISLSLTPTSSQIWRVSFPFDSPFLTRFSFDSVFLPLLSRFLAYQTGYGSLVPLSTMFSFPYSSYFFLPNHAP